MKSICLKTDQIKKRFGGVVALSDGSIEIRSGEVLALVGANGSGKSTLTKIITGVLSKDSGEITYLNEKVEFHNPRAAQKAGIMAVYQELSLVPSLTVSQNIWLANEPLTKTGSIGDRLMIEKTEELLTLFAGTYQDTLRPQARVSTLPPDEKQIVEILKALSHSPDVLILDEATASLDSSQVQCLVNLIDNLRDEGKGIVFVSHRMDEIFKIADRAAVLRNGKFVGEVKISETTEDEIVFMMVGRDEGIIEEIKSQSRTYEKKPILIVENLTNQKLSGISFTVDQGEIVGLGGLRGQGQSNLLHTLFGNEFYSGKTTLFDNEIDFNHPKDAMNLGVALIPGDRAEAGLLLIRSILENFHLPNWQNYCKPFLNIRRAEKDAIDVSHQLNLVMESLESPVSSLSGGNAQKVVIGKWLLRDPKLLLLDDPTKGVDVGTKTEFYRLLNQLVEKGTTILFYSSDDQELLDLCSRILVMQDGLIKAELSGETLTESNLVSKSMGADVAHNNNNYKHKGYQND